MLLWNFKPPEDLETSVTEVDVRFYTGRLINVGKDLELTELDMLLLSRICVT